MTTDIQKRNFDYIDNLGNNLEFYLHYLSTMAKFHKYSAEDLASLSMDAPQRFSAVASPKVWREHFHRSISENARGIDIVRDGKTFTVYDVSETEPPNAVSLWEYDDDLHKRFLDAVVQNDADTSDKIQAVTANLFADSALSDSDKEFAALSTSIVVLERLNQNKNHSEPFRKDIERLRRHLANMSFDGRDYHTLTDTIQKNSQKVLDAFQQSVRSFSVDVMDAEYNSPDLSLSENNPLLKTLGVIDVPEVNKSAEETVSENVATESEVIENNSAEISVTKKNVGEFSTDDFVLDDISHPETGVNSPALLLNYKDDTEFDIDDFCR